MKFSYNLFFSILISFPSAFAALNGRCTGVSGICVKTSTCEEYGGPFVEILNNKCPNDPADVKCCQRIFCGTDTLTGRCMFTSDCDTGNIMSNQCPGGNDFKCCLPSKTNNGSNDMAKAKTLFKGLLNYENKKIDNELFNAAVNCVMTDVYVNNAFKKVDLKRKTIIMLMSYGIECKDIGYEEKFLNAMANGKYDVAIKEFEGIDYFKDKGKIQRFETIIKTGDCGNFCKDYGWEDGNKKTTNNANKNANSNKTNNNTNNNKTTNNNDNTNANTNTDSTDNAYDNTTINTDNNVDYDDDTSFNPVDSNSNDIQQGNSTDTNNKNDKKSGVITVKPFVSVYLGIIIALLLRF